MDDFRTWLLAEQGRHPPRGPMGDAIGYALGQGDAPSAQLEAATAFVSAGQTAPKMAYLPLESQQ